MSYQQPFYKEVICGAKKLWADLTRGQAPRGWAPSFSAVEGVCLQCHCGMDPATGDQFCSQYCMLNYWEELRHNMSQYSGPLHCNFPGCTKQCYVENSGHTHDYCGRSHAKQHQDMKDAAKKQQRSSRGGKKNKNGGSWDNRGHRLGGGNGSQSTHHGQYPGSQQQHTPTSYAGSQQQNTATSYQGPTTRGMGSGHSAWGTGPIYFYNRDEPYYEFTNFYNGAPIIIDGVKWPTTEHYFQAQKFVGTPYVEAIRNVSRPREAFDLSRDPSVSRWRRSDWETVKMDVMRTALIAKFTQNNFLKKKLVDTGSRQLVERSPYDSFWGDGGDGSGLNHLGHLLEELRSKLQSINLSANEVQRDCVSKSSPPLRRQLSDNSSSPVRNSSTTYEIHSAGAGSLHSSKGVSGGLPPSSDLARQPLRTAPGNEEKNGSGTSQENKNRDVPTENLIDLSDTSAESQVSPANKCHPPPMHMQHVIPSSQPPPTLGVDVRGVASSYNAMQVDKHRVEPPSTEGEPMDTEDSQQLTSV